MKENMTCDVAKDLMPLYIDQVCSEDSRRLVEAHIGACEACKKMMDTYADPYITEELKENSEQAFDELVSKVKKRNRLKIILISIGIAGLSILSTILVFGLAMGLLALNTSEAYRTIDTGNYGIHQGHMEGEEQGLWSGMYVFPDKISKEASDVAFFYSCGGASFDNKYQQFLKCTYSDAEYKGEIERLKNITCTIESRKGTVVNHIEYTDTKFRYPAYMAAYGGHTTYEYALCDEKTKTIVYVHMQHTTIDEVAFDKVFLPLEYQNGKELYDNDPWTSLNIYFCDDGDGVHKNFKD